jgi:F-type H+-transporting ATPase subunit alpha
MAQEVMVIYAGTKGFLDDIPVARVQEFQNAFLKYVETRHSQLEKALEQKKELTDDLEKQLKDALADFKGKVWQK